MAAESTPLGQREDVPQLDRAIASSRGEHLAVGRKRNREHFRAVANDVARSAPVGKSQSLTHMSELVLARVRPSAEKATAVISPEWPANLNRSVPVFGSERRTISSSPPETSQRPSGLMATTSHFTAVGSNLAQLGLRRRTPDADGRVAAGSHEEVGVV